MNNFNYQNIMEIVCCKIRINEKLFREYLIQYWFRGFNYYNTDNRIWTLVIISWIFVSYFGHQNQFTYLYFVIQPSAQSTKQILGIANMEFEVEVWDIMWINSCLRCLWRCWIAFIKFVYQVLKLSNNRWRKI